MDIVIIESKNSQDTLKVIYKPTQLHFANINANTDKVSILDNKQTSRFVKLNGSEYLKKAVEEFIPIWRYNNSPFRKLDNSQVENFTSILLAMGVLGAALDNAMQDIEPLLKKTGIELSDIKGLQETLNQFMKSSTKSLGTDLVINSFDYGEGIYNTSLENAKHLIHLSKIESA